MKYILAIILSLILLEGRCNVIPFQEIIEIGQNIQNSTNGTLIFAHVVSINFILFSVLSLIFGLLFDRFTVMENAALMEQRI